MTDLIVASSPKSLISEGFRTLRTNLQFSAINGKITNIKDAIDIIKITKKTLSLYLVKYFNNLKRVFFCSIILHPFQAG